MATTHHRDRLLLEPPFLEDLRVASPCRVSWNDLVGSDRVRFCGLCEKNVFNVSGMTREEAHGLLRANENGTVCLRLHRRHDGTVITADCPEGAKRQRVRRLAMVASGLAAAVIGGCAEAREDGRLQEQGGLPAPPNVSGTTEGLEAEQTEGPPTRSQVPEKTRSSDVVTIGSVFVPPRNPPPVRPKSSGKPAR